MPTYEYHCAACGSTYELRQSFSAETTHTCEECGNGTAKRVLHAPPVVFKGSGWYVTDSRGKNSTLMDSKEPDSAKPAAESGSSTPSTPPVSSDGGSTEAAAAS